MNRIIFIVLTVAAILLIPLIAMQFTDQVVWTVSDFVIMGILLLITGFALDFTLRKAGKYKVAIAIAIILLFLYIWAELAVGIFTNLGS